MLHQQLIAGEGDYAGADPEDRDEYASENVFFVPVEARWSYLQGQAKQPDIGKTVDLAMEAIERENSKRLKGILPKVYGQQKLDQKSLGGLIDLIGSITLGDAEAQAQDVLGRVYEYFLGQFALAEGKKGGQFYTPDIKGFCKSATLADIEKHNFVLTPGRYVGIPDEVEDDVSFEDRMSAFTMALGEQMRKGQLLDEEIKKQLAKVGFVVSDRNVDF